MALHEVLTVLRQAGATEAATVADMLETVASNDDPDMRSPDFLMVCLEELAEWAETARQMLAEESRRPPRE